jgi:hypothetical protein
LRAAGSPGWQLIAYTGLLGGAPITAADLPRDGGPAWPEDDDARTGAALERTIRDLRSSRFESLAWRGASDAWLEKWWPRFAQPIAEGLAASYHSEKVPVVDDEGLAVASGAEVRGSTILPPTLAGWQRFLELAPRSGESFTTLKEIGLAWWGRKIPWDLLSKAKEVSVAEGASPATSDSNDTRETFEKARGQIEALGLPPEKHAYYMRELKKADGLGFKHRVQPIVDQAMKKASNAEEARMGELLRQGRDREEAAWAEAVRRGTEIEELLHGRGEEASRKAAIATLAKKHDAYPVSDHYDAARAAIKALGLPVKKYAQYVKQTDTAIADGKSAIPIVERARKAAAKTMEASSTTTGARSPSSPPPTSLIDVVLTTFNAEPRWRAALLRRRANGFVIAVYPDGRDPDAVVAAIDVIHDNVDEARWLDDRILMSDRDAILERLERALWAAYEVDPQRDKDVNIPSPLQDLEEMMERRSKALGVNARVSQNLERTDGYRQIAEALRDLAEPDMAMVEVLEEWLESVNLMDAAEIVGRARGAEPVAVRQLMSDLWDSILARYPLGEVRGTPGRLRVNDLAIFSSQGAEFVLQRVVDGERASLRRVRITKKELQDDGTYVIDDATDRLMPGADVHEKTGHEFLPDHVADLIEGLYSRIGKFHDELVRAPRTLQDVRTLLYWTAVMLDAPLCQGQVKARATAAFEQAKGLYDLARRNLAEGRSVDAVRRMHAALQRISAAAAEIARSCGEGQIDIAVTPPHLPVNAADKAAIEARSDAVTLPMLTPEISAPRARHGDSQDPVAHAREVLVRAGIHIDPAKLRAVGRLGECCAPNACVRDQARKALRDAGIHASIVRDRLLFQLGQP